MIILTWKLPRIESIRSPCPFYVGTLQSSLSFTIIRFWVGYLVRAIKEHFQWMNGLKVLLINTAVGIKVLLINTAVRST